MVGTRLTEFPVFRDQQVRVVLGHFGAEEWPHDRVSIGEDDVWKDFEGPFGRCGLAEDEFRH